jgi:hypothetical protein
MASALNTLVGLVVTDVVRMHDYIQIAFGDQIGLSIYNQLCEGTELDLSPSLLGKMVASVVETESFIILKFIDQTQLCIDMRPQAYRGPEALQLNRLGEPPVIWN